MVKIKKADWFFIILTTVVWISALLVTVLDLILIQRFTYQIGLMNLLGLIVAFLGITIRLQARRALKQHFSYILKTSEAQILVRQGIYSHIRHPGYLGNLLFWIGFPVILNSLYGFPIMLLLVPCFLYRITIENMLIEKFGNEYIDYKKRSKKLIPLVY